MKRVRLLSPEVARKIAAGEVIDRPNAIVRELLDNAVDSGADVITVEITGGGIDCIRIIDNGSGMSKEDLELCCEPHATSKIQTEQDLLTLSTLGFRGEALASIAAVSRLTVTTCNSENLESYRLEASVTEKNKITPANLACGTIVQSVSLFENFPARRQFLKRPQSEAIMCRQTFIEKAIPRPDIAFRLVVDGKIKLDLPKTDTLQERFVQALELAETSNLFYELKGKDKTNWSYSLVIGESGVFRTDRKNIHIYVNGRKIQEYSLLQAIEYGCLGYFPNGTHPVACLYLNVDSSLVDFNIHPAKKEAKFKDIAPIHKSISTAVKTFFTSGALNAVTKDNSRDIPLSFTESFLHDTERESAQANSLNNTKTKISSQKRDAFFSDSFKMESSYETDDKTFNSTYSAPLYSTNALSSAFPAHNFSAEKKLNSDFSFNEPHPQYAETKQYNFKYLGSALGTFLIAEYNGLLYFIDQHAAHERILFNKFMENSGQKQPLLISYVLETQTESDDSYLESIKDKLSGAGFDIENTGDGRWEITSVPITWQGTEKDLYKDILTDKKPPEQLIRNIAASCACRSAVMDGTVVDNDTAKKIIEGAFNLEDPHCPHGRPVWKVFTKDELFQMVKRT